MSMITAALALILALTACDASGEIDWSNARQIKTGMTEKEVIYLMGEPMIAVFGEKDRWIWDYVNGVTGNRERMHINFKDGIVVDIPRIQELY